MNGISAPKNTAADSVTISRQEAKNVLRPIAKKGMMPIDPGVKSWIDNVIVPALVDRWLSSEDSKAA
jgi:hypothetical protein